MKMFNLIIKTLGLVRDFADAKEWFGKRWFLSKTLWVNAIAVAALWIQSQTNYIISSEEQFAILAVINMIIRLFTTQPLVLREKEIIHMTEKEESKING